MLQSFRAPLVVGAIASVGAAAVITAPADNAGRLLAAVSAPSSAQVTLTAWQNPIIALLDSGELAENYVFGSYYNGGDAPTPGAGETNWPFAGFAQTGGDTLNYLLTQKAELGNYFYVGFLDNFTAEAYLPAVQQWQLNAEDYTSVFLSGLNRAARQLVQGQLAEAGKTVLDATTYVLTNFGARATALVAAIPQMLTTFAGSAIGGTKILVQKTVEIVTQVVASLGTGDVEGAWNAAVDGTLGPSGIPGTLLNLTTGAGVQTGPIVNPVTDIPGNFVPSFRTAFQAAQWTARGALQTNPAAAAAAPAPEQSATPTPAAAVADDDLSTAAADSGSSADAADSADAVPASGGAADPGENSAAPADAADSAPAAAASGKAGASGRKAAGSDRARRAPAGRAGN